MLPSEASFFDELEKIALRRSDIEAVKKFGPSVERNFHRLKRIRSDTSPLRSAIDHSVASKGTTQKAVDKVIKSDAAKSDLIGRSGRLDGTMADWKGNVIHEASPASGVTRARANEAASVRADPLASRANRAQQAGNAAHQAHLEGNKSLLAAEQSRVQGLIERHGTGHREVVRQEAVQSPLRRLFNRVTGRAAPTVQYEKFVPPNIPGGRDALKIRHPTELPADHFRRQAMQGEIRQSAQNRAALWPRASMPRTGRVSMGSGSAGFQSALNRGYSFGSGGRL